MTTLSKEAIDRLVGLGSERNLQTIQTPDGDLGVLVPAGHELQTLTAVDRNLPENIQQRVELYDFDSFVDYVSRFEQPTTTIFAAPGFLAENSRPYFRAHIDFHGPGLPMRNDHVATYYPRYSDQWRLWTRTGGMGQQEFGEFIEENRGDIAEPTAASLIDLVRNFKASRKINYDKTIIEKNGTTKLSYSDETEAHGEIEVPDQITLGIPVYFADEPYAVRFWVRYRVANGGVQFVLKPDRIDIVEQDAFTRLIEKLDDLDPAVYLGN